MSDGDSFIQEVSEEVRRDRMFKLWKRFAPLVIGAIVLVVAVAAGLAWLDHSREQTARLDGGVILSAELEGGGAVLLEQADLLSDGAALIARLRAGADLAQNGELDAAQEAFAAAAEADAVDATLADFAALRGALLRLHQGDFAGARTVLDGFADGDGPFRLLALEARAAGFVGEGDAAAARADIAVILADPAATQALVERVAAMQAALDAADGPGEEPAQ